VIEGSRRKKKKFQNQEKLNFKDKNISLRSCFFEKKINPLIVLFSSVNNHPLFGIPSLSQQKHTHTCTIH
jgi:hypothetical protein